MADLWIQLLQWGPVKIYNTTLTCGAAAANDTSTSPPVTLVAETSAQLLQGIQLLGRLQPFTITLARDMRVPADTWPGEGLLVNRSMVLAGLPPPAPRTLLDLYQVRPRAVGSVIITMGGPGQGCVDTRGGLCGCAGRTGWAV